MKVLIYSILFLFVCFSCNAQDSTQQNKGTFWKNTSLGGSFGLQFGSVTFIDISPVFTHKFTEKFYGGIGIIYQYINDKRYVQYTGSSFKTHIIGTKALVRYFVLNDIFLHSEYQLLNLDAYDEIANNYNRTNVSLLLVGGGYRQHLGENSNLLMMVLWDVLNNTNSPYQNPIFQIGLNIGL